MEISIKEIEGVWTAIVAGRLDSVTAPDFEKQIQPLLVHTDKDVVLDFTDLEYISSAGLRQLLAIRKASLARGGSVTIAHIQSDIRQVLTLTGFTSLFNFKD